jgi:chromate transporter
VAISLMSALEVFLAFLRLGLSSFGGPIAHVGYFHREFVHRRGWVDEMHYAQLIALSQFLPGPASSQIGFSLGLIRAGWLGGLAAFIGFTLPSALLMYAFAHLMPRLSDPHGYALLHGFKLVAVAVVGHGVVTMAARLTPDIRRRCIALASAIVVIFSGSAAVQLAVVAVAALLGMWLCRNAAIASATNFAVRYGVKTGAALVVVFATVLGLALLPDDGLPQLVAAAKAFYRSGALVFGGAHVVLPLLEEAVVEPGWIGRDEFLAGYGAAQGVPGPMFSVAAFLGARLDAVPTSASGSLVSVLAIFLPGLLLVAGVLPMWRMIASRERAASALAGINAGVVGLLAAALYDPVWTSAVLTPLDAFIALAGFALLAFTRASVLIVLLWCVLASLARVAL